MDEQIIKIEEAYQVKHDWCEDGDGCRIGDQWSDERTHERDQKDDSKDVEWTQAS